MQKKIRIFFAVYILLVIKVIIFKYPLASLYAITQTWSKEVVWEGLESANFIPFKTIKMYIDYAYKLNSFENLAGNILVFVPFGFLFPMVKTKKKHFWDMFAHVLMFVLGIEVFQLFSAFGAFDVDDIILNCFGAVLGYIGYRKCLEAADWFREKEKREAKEYGESFEEN